MKLRRPSSLPAERQRKILESIHSRGSAKIQLLSRLLNVSEATVRRDLKVLTARGLIDRTHGGAVLPETSTAFEKLYAEKRTQLQEEKRRIGAAAAARVRDGETIILDSGSTTIEVARHLTHHKHLTIITYDLFIAGSVDYDDTTSVLVSGGTLRPGFNVLVGSEAENFFRKIRVNKAFLGADAIHPEQGVFNATFSEHAVKQRIVEATQEVILVADHSKFGKVALVNVCPLDAVHRIVTDTGLDETVLSELKRHGTAVELA